MRLWLCAASRPKIYAPSASQSKRTPKFSRSLMRSAASLVRRRAITGSTSPAPAVQVSEHGIQCCRPVPSPRRCLLSPIASRAFAALAAGQNGDLARGEFQRGKQTCQTCADNQHIACVDNIRGWRTHVRVMNLRRSCARRQDAHVLQRWRLPRQPRVQRPAPQEPLAE